MKLPHLALTVIEDPDNDGRYHWLLLSATEEVDRVAEFAASDESFASAAEAFEAGVVRWRQESFVSAADAFEAGAQELNQEDEDADPVGDGGTG